MRTPLKCVADAHGRSYYVISSGTNPTSLANNMQFATGVAQNGAASLVEAPFLHARSWRTTPL